MKLEWKTSNSVGIKELDDQHVKLIEITRDLSVGVNSKFKVEAAEVAIEDYRAFAKTHFAYEERMMAEADFPGLNEHRLEHEQFFKDLDALEARLRGGDESASLALLEMAKVYLRDHIGTMDKAYTPFLKKTKFSAAVAR